MRTLGALLVLTLSALVVFALWPEIDLYVARGLFQSTGFKPAPWQGAIRVFFEALPFIVISIFAASYGLRRFGVEVAYAPSSLQLAFLVATMAIGPGLFVNFGLKNHSHRPRPVHTREFGGFFEFRPWYRFDGGCLSNCSFVSGEAATNFWLVAPASLAPPTARPFVIAGAFLIGTLTSVLRLAFGAHYLSDVIVAALIVLTTVQAVRILLFHPPSRRDNVARRGALPGDAIVSNASDNRRQDIDDRGRV
jgi:lipid A 4'-phosphatase